MLTLIRQELYKQLHGKFYIGWGIFILALSLLYGYTAKNNTLDPYSTLFGNGITFTTLALVVFASSILTVDFSQNTVKYLFARQFSRGKILISKLVTIVVMYIYLICVSFVSTEISALVFSVKGNWHFNDAFLLIGATSLYLFLLLSMVLLISNIFKNSAVATAVGIIFVLVLRTINALISQFTENHSWIKFNPLNFLNVNNQIYYGSIIKETTKLSLIQIEVGSIVWGVIFLLITYVVYNRRNV
ncbi:ABC transporter permease subunit [Apilactobacillus kunkeei]|uniref:ABC transporter permease subunit n=1 Tax=Apilactobacillus kunkeei TaxID=148814 RepID=UPI00403338EC